MAGIQRFEDLVAWQRARKLAAFVYRLSAEGQIARDFGFRDQFRKAVMSVMNNTAEGFGRRGDREFLNFLKIAKGSLAEVQSMTYIGLDIGYLSSEHTAEIQTMVRETASVLSGLQEYLSQSGRSKDPSVQPKPTIDHRPSTDGGDR